MKIFKSTLFIFAIVLSPFSNVQAAEVTSTFTDGATLTADQMTEIKDAVNDNNTNVGVNATGIGANATAIGANTTSIGANTTAIGTNTTSIGANTTAIGTNTTSIGANSTAIGTNSTNIGSNTSAIGTNTTNISNNATTIGDNVADIIDHESRIITLEGTTAETQLQLSGVEFDSSSSDFAVTETPSTVMSTEVNAPSSGFVIVSFSSTLRIPHINGITDFSRLWLSTDPASSNTFDASWRYFLILSSIASGTYWSTQHSQAVFQVSAGVSTFYARADSSATGATFRNTSMNAIFVPNRY